MSGVRFNLDLFIPEDLYAAIPVATKTAFRDRIRQLKALAVKINEGQVNEEMTVKAQWHRCHHDTGGSCEKESDI